MPLIKIMTTFIVLLASNDCCGDLILCNFIDVYCDIHNNGIEALLVLGLYWYHYRIVCLQI
jgi:hypothetical protein